MNSVLRFSIYAGGMYLGFEIIKAMWWEHRISKYNYRTRSNKQVMGEKELLEK
jgi:hypothetical protein